MTATALTPRFGEYIPADPEPGVLHISLTYATAVHLCACGCGRKVVTPLNPAGWRLIFDGSVSLEPSVGSGQYPCRSHYHIRSDRVVWLAKVRPGSAGTRPLSPRPSGNGAEHLVDAVARSLRALSRWVRTLMGNGWSH